MFRFKNPVMCAVAVLALLALGACNSMPGNDGATPSAAEPVSVPAYEVTARSLNVRDSPGGHVVGALSKGTRVEAPEPEEEGGWLFVQSSSTSGYVSTKFLRPVAAAPAPAVARTEPAPARTAPAQTQQEPQPAAKEETGRPAPAGSALARVQLGMSEGEVRGILGEPTSQNNYQTGKAWIPYYYGSDTSRLDYKYKQIGIVVFGRNRYSGNTKVIRVDYDPSEDGY